MKEISTQTVATKLHKIEQQMAVLEKEQKEARAFLLESLKKQGVKSVKLEDGTVYVRAFRVGLKVADESGAWEWAENNHSLKVDTAKAMKILKLTGNSTDDKLPDCFARTETEYLTIKRGNDNDE